ncbi:MAG: polysaccharide biosynthesis tyrosine autokinase [Clostridia bacterium]
MDGNSSINESLDLKALLMTFLNHSILIVLAAALIASVTAVYSIYFVDPMYSSTSQLYVETDKKIPTSITVAEMTTAQKLVETCRIISKSNTALDRVSQTLKDQYNIDISAKMLDDITNVSAVTNTQFLRISVVTNDPEKSMRICNAMAESASEEFSRIVKKASIQTVYFGEVEELPVSPNIPLNIVVAAIVGLILSFVIAFIFDMMNVTVKSEDDLSARYGLPVFAEIPDREQKIHNKGYYAYNKSNAKRSGSESIEISIVESYNTARTNLQFALGPHDRKIIVFTSSGPSEGKSTVSSNIVASFAKASNRVLFIDADLRRPAVHNIFKLENKNGLSLMLCGLSKFADVVHKDVIPNLDVITSGPIPPNPSELLISPFMKKIIDAHMFSPCLYLSLYHIIL